MQKLLTELKTLLEQQITLHEGLKADLSQEAETDGKMSAADFLQLQQRKYHWAGQIEDAEARRLEQVDELAQQWNVPAQQLTLKEIITRSPAPLNKSFTASRESLKLLVDEIRALARRTGTNASARLKAIDATLAVIGEAAQQHPTYSQKGRLKQRPPTFKTTSA